MNVLPGYEEYKMKYSYEKIIKKYDWKNIAEEYYEKLYLPLIDKEL